MCMVRIPRAETEHVPRLAKQPLVRYERNGATVTGDLIAVTDDTILINVDRRSDPVACWTHGNFNLVALP